jgi:hypothetical protein
MAGKVEKVSSAEEKHMGDVTKLVYFNGHVYSAGGDGKVKVSKIKFGNFLVCILARCVSEK